MARKSNTRAAQGSGSIRQRPDGRWEARFTYADELGQPQRGSVYGKTQKECRQKLTAALKAVDDGTYFKPAKRYTVAEWLDEWLATYCNDLKPSTRSSYASKIKVRIKPYIGKVQLSSLTNVQVQKFCNRLEQGDADHTPMSPKSIRNVQGVLHKALDQAVCARLIPVNPCDHMKLPKRKKPKLTPLMDDAVTRFLNAAKGDRFERFFIVDLFSGLRLSELIGLQWDDVDLETGTLHVCHQIQKNESGPGYHFLNETKNGKDRYAAIAPSVVKVLKAQKKQQAIWQIAAGPLWNNEHNLVFTDEFGHHLIHVTVRDHFKKIVRSIGMPETRLHDLRHSYAVNALQAGDTVKDVQEQLGHYSSSFTLDTYAEVSETMRQASRERQERFIKSVSDL